MYAARYGVEQAYSVGQKWIRMQKQHNFGMLTDLRRLNPADPAFYLHARNSLHGIGIIISASEFSPLLCSRCAAQYPLLTLRGEASGADERKHVPKIPQGVCIVFVLTSHEFS